MLAQLKALPISHLVPLFVNMENTGNDVGRNDKLQTQGIFELDSLSRQQKVKVLSCKKNGQSNGHCRSFIRRSHGTAIIDPRDRIVKELPTVAVALRTDELE